jgi:hypothetical protein
LLFGYVGESQHGIILKGIRVLAGHGLTMPVENRCPSCQLAYRVPDEFAGTQCRCTGCGAVVLVPQPHSLRSPNPPAVTAAAAPSSTNDEGALTYLWQQGRPTVLSIGLAVGLFMLFGSIVTFEIWRQHRSELAKIPANNPSIPFSDPATEGPLGQPSAQPSGQPSAQPSGQPDRPIVVAPGIKGDPLAESAVVIPKTKTPETQTPRTRTIAAEGVYSLQFSKYTGSGDALQTLKATLSQLPYTLPETAECDLETRWISFYTTRARIDLSDRTVMFDKIREAGFAMTGSARQRDLYLALTIGPQGVSPRASEASQRDFQPAVPVVEAMPAGDVKRTVGNLSSSTPWQLQVDPGLPAKGEAQSLFVPNDSRSGEIYFSDPDSRRAVVTNAHGTMLKYDLISGVLLDTTTVEMKHMSARISLASEEVLAFSPDGTRALVFNAQEDAVRVISWQPGERRMLAEFRLRPGDSVRGEFASDTCIVLFRKSVSSSLIVWIPSTSKVTEYPAEGIPSILFYEHFCTSPGRQYFGMIWDRKLCFFRTDNGAPAGQLELPPGAQRQAMRISGATFSPDGQRLLLDVGETTADGVTKYLIPYDVATARSSAPIHVPGGFFTEMRYAWQGSRFVTVGPGRLSAESDGLCVIDLHQSKCVATYLESRELYTRWDWSKRADPAGTIWLRRSSTRDGQSTFLPLVLPRPIELTRIDESLAAKQTLLRVGDAVMVDVQIRTPSPIIGFPAQVAAIVSKSLTTRGLRVVPAAEKKVMVIVEQLEREGTVPATVHYRLAGISAQEEKLNIPNRPLRVTLSVSGSASDRRWEFAQTYDPGYVVDSEDTPNQMRKEHPLQAAETFRWVRVKSFLQWYTPPLPLLSDSPSIAEKLPLPN